MLRKNFFAWITGGLREGINGNLGGRKIHQTLQNLRTECIEIVVFDIAGNAYRMICKYAFGDKQVHLFVCWIGTHAAYDKLCNLNKQYTVSDF